jgi:D-beta-D-heptose 7-phosphate kinase/D-beta-D-heptose 1-phosphate adenosyltransferase
LKPQILVKGGDYRADHIVGRELVDEVVVIPLVEGVSTTELLNKG